ncbi:hypothetical protein [Asticcacaulis solisilvae]|uniref:hypothetical protein n=1 Tax=Asticcacaulis solisilvae TaxID=1217274 RepID=UPI003FD7C275
MDNRRGRIRFLSESYWSGLYTKPEVIGLTIDILADSPDFAELWGDVPDWLQVEIWEWLKPLHRNTVLYGQTLWGEVISPNLIDLKVWLIREGRCE